MSHITVDFSKTLGNVKIMHSVNNGPAGSKTRRSMSNFELYRQARIPYARNHDASFSTGYGGEYTVDVHRIFRNFDADVNDPASYDFEMTDVYMQDILSVGTKPFYRLGASIEHRKKLGTFPPKDNFKWAQICEHIIRHYNESWADGFSMGIEYWEIWNEPDCGDADGTNPCWQGTREQFVELFVTAFRYLKSCFPTLKIGGPAFTGIWEPDYIDQLFTALQENGLTLDFFSFHGYCNEPYIFYENAEKAWELMTKYGCAGRTELILNEWNYIKGWQGDEFEYSVRSIKGLKGAAFIAGTMCSGQRSKLDQMMYYDARPCAFNGMFDTDFKTALKGYYPFLMYSKLYEMGKSVQSESDEQSLYCTAAVGEKCAGVMLTYFEDADTAAPKQVQIDLKNMTAEGPVQVDFYLLDETYDMELVRSEMLASSNGSVYVNLPLFTTCYLQITQC